MWALVVAPFVGWCLLATQKKKGGGLPPAAAALASSSSSMLGPLVVLHNMTFVLMPSFLVGSVLGPRRVCGSIAAAFPVLMQARRTSS